MFEDIRKVKDIAYVLNHFGYEQIRLPQALPEFCIRRTFRPTSDDFSQHSLLAMENVQNLQPLVCAHFFWHSYCEFTS